MSWKIALDQRTLPAIDKEVNKCTGLIVVSKDNDLLNCYWTCTVALSHLIYILSMQVLHCQAYGPFARFHTH